MRNAKQHSTILRIGAFNVQSLGSKKARNQAVLMTLADIVSRYDVLSVLEVRDGSGRQVADALLRALEIYCAGLRRDPNMMHTLRARECDYDVVLSPRLGSNSYKEQVAVFYRRGVMEPVKAFVYEDLDAQTVLARSTKFAKDLLLGKVGNASANKDPSRPPFVTVMEQRRTGKRILLLSVHFAPGNVAHEMEQAAVAYKQLMRRMKKAYQLDAAMIIGDFKYVLYIR
jgi:hypothetical protein